MPPSLPKLCSWPSDEVAVALGKLWPYMEDNVDELFYFGSIAEGSARRRLQDVLLLTLPRRLAAPQQAAAMPSALLDYARCTWDVFDWEQRDQDQKSWMPSGPGPLAPLAASALAGVAAACGAAHDTAPEGAQHGQPPGQIMTGLLASFAPVSTLFRPDGGACGLLEVHAVCPNAARQARSSACSSPQTPKHRCCSSLAHPTAGGPSEVVVELRRFLLTCAHACLAGWEDRWGESVVGPMLGLALREAATPRPPDAHPLLDYDTPLGARTWQEAAADALRHLSARALAAAHQGGPDLRPLKPLAEAVPQQVLARGGPPAAALVAAVLSS